MVDIRSAASKTIRAKELRAGERFFKMKTMGHGGLRNVG